VGRREGRRTRREFAALFTCSGYGFQVGIRELFVLASDSLDLVCESGPGRDGGKAGGLDAWSSSSSSSNSRRRRERRGKEGGRGDAVVDYDKWLKAL